MKIKTVMLTGDLKGTANAINKQLGLDEVIAEVLPQDKEKCNPTIASTGQ